MARCEFSDLAEESCAHCTGRTGEPVSPDFEVAYRFAARYPGVCGWCERRFAADDPIARTTDGDYLCADCIPDTP
jgi:hypothetical protein